MNSDRERFKALLSNELRYIALQAVSSNKEQVEDDVAKFLIRDMTRQGMTYENGMTKTELVKIISESNINKFSQIVAGAKSIEQFIQEVSGLLPVQFRRMTWKKIENSFGIHWKFNFKFPKEWYEKKVNSRTWKQRKRVQSPPPAPPDPFLQIPVELREWIQKLSESNPIQKKLVKCILDNQLPQAVKGARLEVEKGLYLSIQMD